MDESPGLDEGEVDAEALGLVIPAGGKFAVGNAGKRGGVIVGHRAGESEKLAVMKDGPGFVQPVRVTRAEGQGVELDLEGEVGVGGVESGEGTKGLGGSAVEARSVELDELIDQAFVNEFAVNRVDVAGGVMSVPEQRGDDDAIGARGKKIQPVLEDFTDKGVAGAEGTKGEGGGGGRGGRGRHGIS